MAVNVKEIRRNCQRMSAGWEQARDVEFNGISKTEFDGDLDQCTALDDEIEIDEAALKAKKDRRDDRYRAINQKRKKVRLGVAGNEDYGEDSPLYGAMGFVRESERSSGLTRNRQPNGDK